MPLTASPRVSLNPRTAAGPFPGKEPCWRDVDIWPEDPQVCQQDPKAQGKGWVPNGQLDGWAILTLIFDFLSPL